MAGLNVGVSNFWAYDLDTRCSSKFWFLAWSWFWFWFCCRPSIVCLMLPIIPTKAWICSPSVAIASKFGIRGRFSAILQKIWKKSMLLSSFRYLVSTFQRSEDQLHFWWDFSSILCSQSPKTFEHEFLDLNFSGQQNVVENLLPSGPYIYISLTYHVNTYKYSNNTKVHSKVEVYWFKNWGMLKVWLIKQIWSYHEKLRQN